MPVTSPANPFTLKGLTASEVEERIAAGKVNVNTGLKTKSVRELIMDNVCTLFNLINLVLAALVVLTGAWKNLTFLFIVLANTAIGIMQALRSKRLVDRLTLLASKKAVAVRDGSLVELDLDQIVIDDLVRLGRGDQVPADSVVVEGEGHVNESLLTGESDPIHKVVGSELMSGSFLDSGLILARVTHVGADNYVARISNEAKYVKQVNSEIMSALNAIVRSASIIMVPLGIALFLASVHEAYAASHPIGMGLSAWVLTPSLSWSSVSAAVLSTVGALLGMIPQGLVLLTSSVLAIATVRLARRNVLAQQLYCIETLARVDVLCLDKTGTITSGRMEVAGVYAARDGAAVPVDGAGDTGSGAVDFALANIARATSADANETCTALLKRYEGSDVPFEEPLSVIPFNSAKKWSGASFARGSFVMGAAQFVLGPEEFARYEVAVNDLADSCRVLVVAEVGGFTAEGGIVGTVRPLGFVTIRDEIRASAAQTIGYFCDQGVALNVISGDDPRTVSSIARMVGVPGADSYVDATTLDTPAKIDAAAGRYHVFGRVTPQQKRELVVALKRRGHTVAMTGDGVNDVLALKEADCSVAMAAGSDAARNVAELVLVDNDFASMPAVVAEGRRSINNLQRSAALFLTKTLFSMGLAAICIWLPPYPFQPITMTLINFFCIGFPSFVLALEPNRSRVRGSFLVNVLKRALPAAVSVLAACLLCMLASGVFGYAEVLLSTMCLIVTCAVGCCLIWRISRPFTPLRVAVFAFVVVGLAIGILGFPEFFSIGRPGPLAAALLVVFSALGCWLFSRLAGMLDASLERATSLATGFGRGVRVSGRKGSRRVSSTGSSARRLVARLRARGARGRDGLALRLAQEDADRAVRSERAVDTGSDRARRQAAGAVGASGIRVEQSAQGIRVRMPAGRRGKGGAHE